MEEDSSPNNADHNTANNNDTTFNILTSDMLRKSHKSLTSLASAAGLTEHSRNKSTGFVPVDNGYGKDNDFLCDYDIEMGNVNEDVYSRRSIQQHDSQISLAERSIVSTNTTNTANTANTVNTIDATSKSIQSQTIPLLGITIPTPQEETWRKITKEVIHYYTHFLLFVIFEILFYFNYIVAYERQLVYRMVESAKNDLINLLNVDTTEFSNNPYYDQLCTNLVDNRTDKGNAEIYNDALYLIIGMSSFLMFLIVIETNVFTMRSTFPKEFGKSLMLMIFVGLFDYLFFNFFILNYKVIDTAELMCYLYEHDFKNDNGGGNTTRF